MQGVSERLARVFHKRNIRLYSKAGLTIRNLVVAPKDSLEVNEQCGAVYQYNCETCGEIYIGETGRSLGERIEEHEKSVNKRDGKLALSQHQDQAGHVVKTGPMMDKFKVLEREQRDTHRKVLEAIQIKIKGASMNRNEGYDLPDLYLPLLREEAQGGRTPQHDLTSRP